MTPIADQNEDEIDDFHITYPSGDLLVMYDLASVGSLPLS